MNSSFFTSDRATHVKIGLTAVLATALVIVVGVFAKPVDNAQGPAARAVTSTVTASQGLPVTR